MKGARLFAIACPTDAFALDVPARGGVVGATAAVRRRWQLRRFQNPAGASETAIVRGEPPRDADQLQPSLTWRAGDATGVPTLGWVISYLLPCALHWRLEAAL
jgi:hypothetical protein